MPKYLLLSLFFGLFLSCGDDDSEDDPKSDDAYEVSGKVVKATSTTINLTFSDGEAGAKYFIMPFATGSTTGAAAVQGGDTATTAVNFTVKASGGASFSNLTKPQGFANNSDEVMMDARTFDHELRSILNRFNPDDANTWEAINRLEKVHVTDGPYQSGHGLVPQAKNLRANFEALANNIKHSPRTKQDAYNFAGTCPDQSTLTTIGDSKSKMDATTVPLKSTSSDYCLYVHATGGLVSETSVDAMKTSIESALKSYKEVIYKDSFSKVVKGYTFQPLIFVLPYGDSTYWKDSSGSFKISAAFVSSLSIANGRPSIYVAADQSKVGSETSTSKLKELFHSSIAHELQHAVFHYYRNVAGLANAIDAPQFDEGLAHLMEDILGYGEVNFSQYPQAFISQFAFGLNPALADISSGTGTAAQRGAAQSLFYYLVSQKGGVSFDGTVSGGDGLGFVRSYVTGSTTNISGIVSAYGGDWTETIGNFMGALAIDNGSTVEEPAKYKVQVPQKDIANTLGTEGKTYGMRFHRFGDLQDLPGTLANFDSVSTAETTLELTHYLTQPLILTLGSSSDTVTVTLEQEYEGAGVSVVRFQ